MRRTIAKRAGDDAVGVDRRAMAASRGPRRLPRRRTRPRSSGGDRQDLERWIGPAPPGAPSAWRTRGRRLHQRLRHGDLEYGVRIRPDTIFESGSVAKQFTAAAIVLLELDGKLSLDDPVAEVRAGAADFGTPILIRHFLNHTSGLRSQWPMLSSPAVPPRRRFHTVDDDPRVVSGTRS